MCVCVCVCVYIYIYISIDLVSRVFTNSPRDQGSVSLRVNDNTNNTSSANTVKYCMMSNNSSYSILQYFFFLNH